MRAIGAGTVVSTTSGWPGGVLGIETKAADGARFLAVYGHLDPLVDMMGTSVVAGQVIGTLSDQGGRAHLHLGVRPVAVGESAASVPLRGASTCTETSVVTYGYVSPLPWLAEHPPR